MTQPEYDEELHQLISHTMNRITTIVQEDGQNTLYTTLINALKKAVTVIETQKSKGRIRKDPDYLMDWQ
jgi:hypothetical protein